jgi:hypothetical protein
MPDNNTPRSFGDQVSAALRWLNPVPRVQNIANNVRNDPLPAAIGLIGNRMLPGAGPAGAAAYQWLRGINSNHDWRSGTVPSTNARQADMGNQIAAQNPWQINSTSPLAQYLGLGEQPAGQQQDSQIGQVWNNAGDNPLQFTPWSLGGGARPQPGQGAGWFGYGSIGNGGGATATNAGNWGSYSGLGSMNPTGGTTSDSQLLAAYLGMNLTR